jgi:hypothetical protein
MSCIEFFLKLCRTKLWPRLGFYPPVFSFIGTGPFRRSALEPGKVQVFTWLFMLHFFPRVPCSISVLNFIGNVACRGAVQMFTIAAGGDKMIYSEKYKVLFISVPKTGTTSLTAPLMETLAGHRNLVRSESGDLLPVGEHWTLLQIAELVGWRQLEGYTIVGGVRNPWDRVVSAYNFYNNGRVVKRIMSGERRNIKALFKVFLAKLLPFSVWLSFYKTLDCYAYLCDASGELRAEIIQIENMNDDVAEICKKIGIKPFTPGKENVSSRKRYADYFNPRTRELVRRRCIKDVEAFDYRY